MPMNVFTSVFFTCGFVKILFLISVAVVICLFISCGFNIRKYADLTEENLMSVALSMIMLLQICLFFSFVALREDHNDYGSMYESVTDSVSYELKNNNNVIYVYERF